MKAQGVTVRRWRSVVVTSMTVAGLSAASSVTAATGLDGWGPAQVIDERSGVAAPTAIFSTAGGRAAVLYRVGGETWASSRPPGDASQWAPPEQLGGAPEHAVSGPLATGAGGGAVVFLKTAGVSPTVTYAVMSPQGEWSDGRAFPFGSTFAPRVALVQPGSGIVAVGSGRHGGMVRAAVKPQGGGWQLSPRLPLPGHKLVRGAWLDEKGHPHILVAAAHDDPVRRREMFTAILNSGADGPRWGPVRQVPRGTGGNTVGDFHTVSMASTPAGGITVSWQEADRGSFDTYVRHRDPVQGWSTPRRIPTPLTGNVESTLADNGTTRLSYVTWTPDTPTSSEGSYQMVTRLLSVDGVLSEEEVLDSWAEDHGSQSLEAARGAPGDLLIRWTRVAGITTQPMFRCLAGDGCVSVGSMSADDESGLAMAPDGTGFVAGLGDDIPGCPTDALCSRQIPTTEGTP